MNPHQQKIDATIEHYVHLAPQQIKADQFAPIGLFIVFSPVLKSYTVFPIPGSIHFTQDFYKQTQGAIQLKVRLAYLNLELLFEQMPHLASQLIAVIILSDSYYILRSLDELRDGKLPIPSLQPDVKEGIHVLISTATSEVLYLYPYNRVGDEILLDKKIDYSNSLIHHNIFRDIWPL